MTPGPDGQAVGCNPTIKQVRLLPASLTDSGVAQVVEHLPEEEGAAGSTPAAGTGNRAPRSQRTNSLIGFSTTSLTWRSRFDSGNSVAAATCAGAKRVHDVAAACQLAMLEVRVRLPLG